MVTYRDNGHTSSAKKFNYHQSSARAFIEQSFGILKQKFKILNYIDLASQNAISEVIMACVILHNFIINKVEVSDSLNDISTNAGYQDYQNIDNTYMPVLEVAVIAEGITIRNCLTSLFFSYLNYNF